MSTVTIPVTIKGDVMKLLEEKAWKEGRSPDITLLQRMNREKKKE